MHKGYFVVDADGHVVPDEWVDWSAYMPQAAAAELEPIARAQHVRFEQRAGLQNAAQRPKTLGPYDNPAGWDPAARLRDLDTDGIDVAVLFPHVVANGITETGHAAEVCRGYNTWLTEYCAANPRRLKGVATLPLGDIPASVTELNRALAQDCFVGLLATEHYAGKSLADPYFTPLWAAAADLQAPVMVHLGAAVWDFLRRLHYPLIQERAIGNPLNAIIGVMDVLCSGLLDRHPGLRFAFLEGNLGWLPWWLDRLDARYQKMGTGTAALRLLPSAYFQEGHIFIAGDADERHLAYALAAGGEDAALFHTDYPHWDAVFPGSVEAVLGHTGLTDRQLRKFLGGNAARLFGARLQQEAS